MSPQKSRVARGCLSGSSSDILYGTMSILIGD
jgi:hypothetical protein